MSVWFYNFKSKNPRLWEGWIVLFDGENTYWSEEMKPSCGYVGLKAKTFVASAGIFYYIGELE